MAAITYGVNGTEVAAAYPQIDIAADAPVTTSRLETLIENAASELTAVIANQYGNDAPTAINDDSSTEVFRNCRRIVLTLLGPSLYFAAHHVDVPDYVQSSADRLRDDLRARPGATIGYLPTGKPDTQSAASAGSLSASGTAGEGRRYFDGRAHGKTRGGFVY